MLFTKLPENAFEQIQFNAGILVKSFDLSTLEVGALLGATSGGLDFKAKPNYIDWGEDIDNCPKNTKELKDISGWDITLNGTYVTITTENVKSMLGAADIAGNKLIPRNHLKLSDFEDVWWVGDYSRVNSGKKAGFAAIHMINALTEDGFSIKSEDNQKGKAAFSYKAHYSMAEIDEVPFEVYVQAGTEAAGAAAVSEPAAISESAEISEPAAISESAAVSEPCGYAAI